MNTINQLTSELTNLSSESKRRNLDIKQASEKSLEILKTYNTKTSEQVFLKNLSKSPDFITPFLLSCQTRNPKYISISISCFHKLITSHSIPITKLELVLDAFLESTNLAIEIQLKILQCLPFFFQNYSIFINDKNLFKLLSICSLLQNSNKSIIVSNTASATLSQLINLVFEKINDEDKIDEIDRSYVVPIDNDQTLQVGLNAYDGQRIFQDLCMLIEHQKPQYLKTSHITENFGFEILESVLKTNRDIFNTHIELGFLLRTKIVPILLRFFANSNFTIMVRVSRLILLLIREQFEILKIETEVILSLLNYMLTKDSASPIWKKILALEIFKKILSDINLVGNFFLEYDHNNSKQIFNDYFTNCYDILNESRYLLNTGDVLQPPLKLQEDMPGLFMTRSTVKIPFIELLDKSDPPPVNETYPLYLILSSLNHLSIELTKDFEELVDKNYQIILSMYELFIFSTLDQDFFNKLLKSLSKMCHFKIEFLKLLLRATLNLNGKIGYQYKSIVGTISSTLNSLTNHISTRQINARNILCFKAFIGVTISMGTEYTEEHWRWCLICLQWMDYYGEIDIKKLNENISVFPTTVFNKIIKALISLQDSEGSDQPFIEMIQPCAFNKKFYINYLVDLCKINPRKFLIEDVETWSMISQNYFKLIRTDGIKISQDFNQIIMLMAELDDELIVLKSLNQFVDNLLSLPVLETFVQNVELEIQSQVLDTLKNLLDKYGSTYKHWDLVFNIINSSFKKKATKVINSSFDALKMILDEFLNSLPIDQFKILIDCISNFVSQDVDLNISLNSISYFWLISDFLSHESDLYIYLLTTLSKNIKDPRLQVRNGSIQTFFNIIDSSSSQDWNKIYKIFIDLFKVDKEWIDSYSLTISGFVKLYLKFLSKEFQYWPGLMNYFQDLLKLNDIELNLKIYKNFHDLITPFTSMPIDILEFFYKFWTSTKIIYNLVANNLYQESLTSLMICFPKLYELIQPILTIDKVQEILKILNSCVKYPVLPDHINDDLRCTPLQESVYENFLVLVSTDNSLLLEELISIIILPFSTRDKIVSKFANLKQFKIASFVSISHRCTDLLETMLSSVKDETVFKIYKSLLEPIRLKAKGISIKKDLWIQCTEILMSLNEQIVTKDCSLILELIYILNSYEDDESEESDIANLTILYQLCVDHIKDKSLFIKCLYQNSFLYKLNEIDTKILRDDDIDKFMSLPSINDSIELIPCQRLNLKKFNLLKLIELNSIDPHFFLLRICISGRKYLNLNQLINKHPIYDLQHFEMSELLKGYLQLLQKKKDDSLKPLILKLLQCNKQNQIIANILELI